MNIALIGPGGIGSVHYQNYRCIKNANIRALVGTSEADRERAQAWGLHLYPTIAELCQHETIELIDICAPTFLHKRLALEAFKEGKHVLCEKPAALNVDDALSMYRASEAAGVQLYIGQVVQFAKETEVLRQVIADQRYGKPLDACFERLSARPNWSSGSWLSDKSKSGQLPYDLHIHDLDLIISLFGAPKSGSFTACGRTPELRDQYRFTYDFGALHVSAEAAWFNAVIPFTARWRVYFERGLLIYDGQCLTAYPESGEIETFDISDPIQIDTDINLPPTNMFLRELSHYISCAERGVPSSVVPKAQVIATLQVLKDMALD